MSWAREGVMAFTERLKGIPACRKNSKGLWICSKTNGEKLNGFVSPATGRQQLMLVSDRSWPPAGGEIKVTSDSDRRLAFWWQFGYSFLWTWCVLWYKNWDMVLTFILFLRLNELGNCYCRWVLMVVFGFLKSSQDCVSIYIYDDDLFVYSFNLILRLSSPLFHSTRIDAWRVIRESVHPLSGLMILIYQARKSLYNHRIFKISSASLSHSLTCFFITGIAENYHRNSR